MSTLFNWADKNVSNRKALPYAAVSAQSYSETYEEFKANTSGYVNPSSYQWWKRKQREMAVNLFSLAVKQGFIDC